MLRSSTYPESSALLSIPLHTPHSRRTVFVDEIEHDSVWTEYLQLAESHDLRMINEWNNFLDVILVFIGLLIAILTSFAIGTQKMFSRDPAEVTNELLVYIFNKLSNSSSGPEFPLELDKVTKLGSDNHRKAVSLNLLLFVSLALSIVISMAAMAAKLWLIQYLKLIRSAAPPYDRAMKRQELFSGMESWKFRRVLNTLPLFTLVAVILLGVFIYLSIQYHHGMLGFFIGKMLGIGLTFLMVVSSSAAFISSSPFQSPFSRFIRAVFDLIPSKGRTIVVCIITIIMSVATTALVVLQSQAWQFLILIPVAGVFAVASTPQRKEGYSPLCGPPRLVLVGFTTLYLFMAIAAYPNSGPKTYISLSGVGYLFGGLVAFLINKLTQFVPDTLEVEAVSWLLESSPWPKLELFEKASHVASTPQRKAILLKTLHRLLPPLIASRRRHRPGGPEHNELKIFLACLEEVSDFRDSERNLKEKFLHNKGAIKHPELPNNLRDQLENLRESDDESLKNAAEAVLCRYPAIKDDKHVYQREDEA